jgi:preprotein translocase subunit Sec63
MEGTVTCMNVEKSYEILGVPPGASLEEITQTYNDLVQVWNPERFAHDPTLRTKAEQQTAEIDRAFHTVRAQFQATTQADVPQGVPPEPRPTLAGITTEERKSRTRLGCLIGFAVLLVMGGLISPVTVTLVFMWCLEPEHLFLIGIGAFIVWAIRGMAGGGVSKQESSDTNKAGED